ncbi:hypothetical protein CSW59_09130 [Caulobacter sp. BP25]|nr:hypothetical protein CSW59_09130 [Caulobacter sp. BP25]
MTVGGLAEAKVQASAAAPSAEAMALTRRYIAAMRMEQSMKPMMLSMVDAMIEQQAQRYPNLNDDQRKRLAGAVMAAVEDVYNNGLMARIADKMAPGMATVYSVDELKALVAFYESPIGQGIIEKMPALGQISGRAIMELLPEMQNDLQSRIVKNVEALNLGK